MTSIADYGFSSALRRLLRTPDTADPIAAPPRRRRFERNPLRLRGDSPIVRRELEAFRRSQGLPYWHHDRWSD